MTTIIQQPQRGQPRVYIWAGDTEADKVDVSADVIGFETSKKLGSPTGSFTLTLMPSVGSAQTPADMRRITKLYRANLTNRVVSIGWKYDGGIMLGLVSNVAESHNFGGSYTRTLTITGQDFGKVLVNDNVVSALMNQHDAGSIKFLDNVKAALGPSTYVGEMYLNDPLSNELIPTLAYGLSEVIDWILAISPSMTIPIMGKVFGGSGKVSEYINTASYSSLAWNDGKIWSTDAATYSGNIWGYIQSMIDPDFYEVVIDSYPLATNHTALNGLAQVYLMVRPKPFDEKILEWASVDEQTGMTWEDLKTKTNESNHDIDLSEMISAQFSYGDSGAISSYVVTSPYTVFGASDGSLLGMQFPLLDTYIAKRYGIKSMKSRLTMLGLDPNVKSDPAAITDFIHRLFNWYRYAPFFENATITIAGGTPLEGATPTSRELIRVGDPVRLPWRKAPYSVPYMSEDGMRYYCTGVSQSWRSSPGRTGILTTRLDLTRGHNASMIAALDEMVRKDAPVSNPAHFADSLG
ncbi:MAG: hypothetical protein WC911_01975 [Thermoleophilia bacterium]